MNVACSLALPAILVNNQVQEEGIGDVSINMQTIEIVGRVIFEQTLANKKRFHYVVQSICKVSRIARDQRQLLSMSNYDRIQFVPGIADTKRQQFRSSRSCTVNLQV